ncbi:hypothetical protein NliqN6_5069 [Naganishia liquefaciens]|uniref:Inosine/uridine-preferring nucleoside hydrolase domain-containing protein n=1 Tax=Naganishia liquefaciens TaxID=104408 RepID=A0A8H3TX09_9TREE|nr:hypothetical protein NliqN6_5069 [Naganishia liquefaciens]
MSFSNTAFTIKNCWLDCDPGHDDAIALLLALFLEESVNPIGVSTVNGNAPLLKTHVNASQLLALYRAPTTIPLHRGFAHPLLKADIPPPVSIHGTSGLDGVKHLPPPEHPAVQMWHDQHGPANTTVIEAFREMVESRLNPDGSVKEVVSVVITGPSTNVAAFKQKYPELYESGVIDRAVIMGGAFDIPQWTPYAEFNIATDPDALAELLTSRKVPVVLAPLNLTHQAIFDEETHAQLLAPGSSWKEGEPLPQPKSEFRESLSTMMTFFREAYITQFGFTKGPPLHDPLCVLHLAQPDSLAGRWAYLTVDTSESERNGETRATYFSDEPDQWEDQEKYIGDATHDRHPNCYVMETLDREAFMRVLLECVDRAEKVIASTPL